MLHLYKTNNNCILWRNMTKIKQYFVVSKCKITVYIALNASVASLQRK